MGHKYFVYKIIITQDMPFANPIIIKYPISRSIFLLNANGIIMEMDNNPIISAMNIPILVVNLLVMYNPAMTPKKLERGPIKL